MKIAMLGHKRIPGREGGVEIVVGELAVRMASRGERVEAYNRWDLFTEGGRVGDKFYKGVRIRQIPTLKNSKLNAFVYSVLASLRAIFGRYNVLHYHAIGSCAMLPIARPFCRCIVATVHGLDWQRAKWNRFASFYLKFGEKMAARYADEIIVLSEGNRRYFKETYGRETLLIPNGMVWTTPPPPNIILSKYGLSTGDYALFLARIVPEKGLHYLLDAFKQIKTVKRLVVAGKVDFDDEYNREIVRKAAEDERVIMAGFVQGQEWSELFGNCSVYVLPSDVEGMPISLLEALGFGARCLVSDIEENVDAGKGSVRTFPKGDVEGLRDALEDMLEHPEIRPQDGAQSAAWEDWDSVTDRTLGVYHSILDRKRRKRRA